MVKGYMAAALWSTVDDNDVPLDSEYHEIEPATRERMWNDCRDYMQANMVDLVGMDSEQAGHDFWLTRNGHGAGYWDRGLGERGERLTDACRPYGEYSIYVGDDSRIYGQ
jgi:hypothetical protein